MKTYRIFLASSAELVTDRQAFEVFLARLNDEFLQRHVHFELYVWERESEAVFNSRKQDQYNQNLAGCDLFVLLFWSKVGLYTNEEFDVALNRFRTTARPLIFTYHKTTAPNRHIPDADRQSRETFERKVLHEVGHFTGSYNLPGELTTGFRTELDKLFANGTLEYGQKAECLSAGQPAVPAGFIGRENELQAIRQKMEQGGTLMLINSEGGIGKTSIAARYWNDYLYQYRYNAWLFCDNGIVDEIKKLAPKLHVDLTQIPESQHVYFLRTALQNLPKDCLLVLDNANNDAHIDAFRQAFEGLHWHILITSRCQGVLPIGQEYPIAHLPPPLAKELFSTYYREESPAFHELLDQLLHAVGYNTLLIELFAKNMTELAAFGETLADFLEQLKQGGLFLGERSFTIKTAYTVHVHTSAATTDDILNVLYDLTKLAEADRYWLVNMALLPASNYPLTFLLRLFEPEDSFQFGKQLKNLARKGWLISDTKNYRMSPVVQELVLKKNSDQLGKDAHKLVERLNFLLDTEGFNGLIQNIPFIEGQQFVEIGKFVLDTLPVVPELSQCWLCNNVATYFYNLGLWDEARTYADKLYSLSIARKNRFYQAVSLFKTGRIEALKGDLERGTQFIGESNQLFALLLAEDPDNKSYLMCLVESHHSLASFNFLLYRRQVAVTHLKEIVRYDEQLVNDPMVAMAYSHLIELTFEKDPQQAEFYYTKTIELLDKLENIKNPSVHFLAGISYIYRDLGNFAKRKNEIDEALHFFELANQFLEKSNISSLPSLYGFYNIVLADLGELYLEQNRFDEALNCFERFHSKMRADYDLNSTNLAALIGLGESLEMLGSYYRKRGDYERAVAYYLEDLTLTKAFYDSYPALDDVFSGLIRAYERLISLYEEMGKHNEAEIYRKLLNAMQ